MKFPQRAKAILQGVNSGLKTYKPIIDALGVTVGIGMVILTWNTIRITQKSLELSQKQYSDIQVPVWDWDIKDSLSMVTLKSTSANIRVQIAEAYFPKSLFERSSISTLSQPDFNFHLSTFREKISDLFRESSRYDSSTPQMLYGNLFPFGLDVNYIQYGESRSVRGIFGIQYTIVQEVDSPRIIINGIIFQNYIDSNQDLRREVDKLYSDYYESHSQRR
ncbi:MAG: hypothetical protein ACRC6V_12395 [Bacteroidales bacterium]